MGGGGGSSSSYHEEVIRRPDDVKIAELNAQSEITKKELEAKLLEMQKNAQIEITETNARLMVLMKEAESAQFKNTYETLSEFTKQINTLAQERIAIIEHANLEQVQKINKHYTELINNINEESFDYLNNKMIKLFDNANRFEKGSDAYQMYYKSIDMLTAGFLNSINERVKSAEETQRDIIGHDQELRNMIIGQTQLLVEKTMNHAGQLINSSFMNELNQDIKKSLGQQNINSLTHQDEE